MTLLWDCFPPAPLDPGELHVVDLSNTMLLCPTPAHVHVCTCCEKIGPKLSPCWSSWYCKGFNERGRHERSESSLFARPLDWKSKVHGGIVAVKRFSKGNSCRLPLQPKAPLGPACENLRKWHLLALCAPRSVNNVMHHEWTALLQLACLSKHEDEQLTLHVRAQCLAHVYSPVGMFTINQLSINCRLRV